MVAPIPPHGMISASSGSSSRSTRGTGPKSSVACSACSSVTYASPPPPAPSMAQPRARARSESGSSSLFMVKCSSYHDTNGFGALPMIPEARAGAPPSPDHHLVPFRGKLAPDHPSQCSPPTASAGGLGANDPLTKGRRSPCRGPPSAGSTWDGGRRAGRRPRARHASAGTPGRTATIPGSLQRPWLLRRCRQSIALPSVATYAAMLPGLRGCNARLAAGGPCREWAYCTTIVTRLCAPHKVGLLNA